MLSRLENEFLVLQVAQKGAEMKSVFDKQRKNERVWQANPEIWGYSAPLLFPWCGRLFKGEVKHKGGKIAAPAHGFARTSVFEELKAENALHFELRQNEETQKIYPYDFCLEVEYRLEGRQVIQQVKVKNTGQEVLPFGLGFHPGFMLEKGEEYNIIFENDENAELVLTPQGLVSGEAGTLQIKNSALRLKDDSFINDSYCFKNLNSKYIMLKNIKNGEGVKVYLDGFDYCLLWGPAKGPLPFVCIEPWHTLPDFDYEGTGFENKKGNICLEAGAEFCTVLKTEYI